MPRPQHDFTVNQYRPTAKIVVYSGSDIYELESDIMNITRSKTMGQASGQWAIQLVDRIGTDGLTWQQRIRTGDYIEIYQGNGTPQLTMRGFVINAQRSFDIGQTGGPVRYSTLNGLDMGYILQANQVRYLWQFDPTAVVGNNYQLDSNFGMTTKPYTPVSFFKEAMDNIVNGTGVKQMQSQVKSGIPPYFDQQCDLPSQYMINTLNVQAFTGQYWNLLSYYASPPFAELFYVDLPNAPTMYYRQPPYRDLDGSYLGVFDKPSALLPTVTVKLSDKKTHSLGKSANEMYAFFMTYSDLVMLDSNSNFNYIPFFGGAAANDITQGSITGSVGTTGVSNPIYDKNIENRYGFQQLSVSTPFISGLTQGPFSSIAVPMNTWMYNAFKNNDQFESGTITVHGDPNIVIGCYINVPEWDMDFYVQGITDNFVQYGTWEMTLQVIRGYAYGSSTKPNVISSSGAPAKTTTTSAPAPKPTPPPPAPVPSGSDNAYHKGDTQAVPPSYAPYGPGQVNPYTPPTLTPYAPPTIKF